MHFVVNRACGSENKISSSLAALKSRTTIDDQVLAGETLSPSDIATQASPSIPLPPKRSSIRRLPRAVRARLKRRCQFEDSTSKSFIDEWIDRHKSSGCKRRRVVICSDEADDHSRLVSEDENSVTGGNRRVEKKNVAKDSRSKSRAAQSIDGSSNKIEPELPKNNASSNSDILPHTSEEDKPTIDKEGKNNLMTGDSTTGTRIVTPTPSEGEPSVCDEDAQETSCETSRADNSAKKPRTGHEEDYCNVLLYISRLSLNIRYPSDSKFADPVEEISEPTPERQAEKDKTGEGKGKRAKKEDSAGDKQSEEEVESQGMPTRDYPGASKPLSLLFQEKAAQEAKQRAEALAAADARQKLLVEESKAQASEKEPEVAELEVESTATEAPERMIIDKERGKDAVSSDEPEEEVATEVSSSSYATVSQPETSEKPIAKQPVEIVDLSVDTDSEIGDDDEAAFPSPTMTRQVAPMQQEARRVSQSPETARSSVRWSLSSEATETSDREEQEAEEDASFDFDENCLVGKCERIAKDPAMEAYLAGGAEELPPYPSEIYNYLWGKAEDEDNIGHTVEEVEESFAFRLANGKITKDVSTNQNKAMYGRITPSAMDKIIRKMLCVRKDHIFADFGHGIGNACLQASYTIGCQSKGIELVNARFYVSEALNRSIVKATEEMVAIDPEMRNYAAGRVELKLGRIEDPQHRDWLTDVNAVFVNNFNEVFGSRSTFKDQRTIDDYIAALFAKMKPGTSMVTMEPIISLEQTQSEANAARRRNKLAESTDASFYEVEKVELGPANECVSWSTEGGNIEPIYCHKYTRLEQENGTDGSVFLCTNGSCKLAKAATPIPAFTVEEGSGLLVLNYCPGCKSSGRRKERKRKPRNLD